MKATKQDWSVGATVKVGFLTLTMIAKIPTPGDFKPDAYVLASATKGTFYEFVPHNGLTKITADEARALLAEGKRLAGEQATDAIAKASASAAHAAGVLIGLTLLKATGLRFGKEHRDRHWYSHVAANQAADGFVQWFPYGRRAA